MSLTIVTETKKVYEYHSQPIKTKTVETQHGQPSNPPVRSVVTRNTPVENSPKKLNRKVKTLRIQKYITCQEKQKKYTQAKNTEKKGDRKML